MTLVRTALAALLVALVAVGGTWVVWSVDESVRRDRASAASERAERAAAARPAKVEPVAVLREWDAARAAAWAAGDVDALAELYRAGSATGAEDVAMLRAYLRRGLVVEGLSTQVVEVRELSRGDEVLVLDVTDRVSGGTVVGRGVRRILPRDAVSRREVELRRRGDVWRVVEVVERSVAARVG